MRVAIVGAGFSGAMAAVEIARAVPGADIHLIEKTGRFGEGAAYSTRSPGHLLNVRASQMSALADSPDHFTDWAGGRGYGPDDYVPRREFRAYLQELLADARGVERVADEALSVADGALVLASGRRLDCDSVVLAGGNYSSRLAGALGERAVNDPWNPETEEAVAAAAQSREDVLLVGTGLTMVDLCISLEEAGFEGRITACSRRGLVPRPHVHPPVEPLNREPPARLGELVREVRSLEPWRGSVDGLRPCSVALWRGFDEGERSRFLRHLRPWWDVHRHRIAPEVAARIERMRETGRLEVLAGRIARVEGEEVTIALRGGRGELTRHYGSVFNCTGPQGDVGRVDDPLIRSLIESGSARPAAHGLGLEVEDGFRVAGTGGSPRLYALGPLTKSAYWEIVAVPDIRDQVKALAEALASY